MRSYWVSDSPQDYYLYAGRLISHKRVDIVIEACNRMKRRLIVAGDGLEQAELEKLAGETVTFTDSVKDAELKKLYANYRALIFPINEDFGIVPVEAQAVDRPAYRIFKSGNELPGRGTRPENGRRETKGDKSGTEHVVARRTRVWRNKAAVSPCCE